MNRTTYLNIAGKEYPMRFSMGTNIRITERYGSMKGFQEILLGDGGEGKALKEITWILKTMIDQGCAYKNLFEKDMPAPESAPVKDGKYVSLTEEELEIGLDLSGAGMMEIKMKIFECFGTGNKHEVEEKKDEDKKNEMTTQEQKLLRGYLFGKGF